MAGIATKHLRSIKVDAAITVGKPEGQEEDEPEACLGMLRLDHIDISSCPKLPDRFEFEAKAKGQAPDVLRASQIMHLSPADIESLAQMA